MYIVKVIGDPIHPETTTYILQDENTHYIYEAQIELAANEAGSLISRCAMIFRTGKSF